MGWRFRLGRDSPGDVGDDAHEGQLVNGGRLEAVVKVELSGYCVLGVDQQQPSADHSSHLQRLEGEVLQERGAEALAGVLQVDREAGQQDGGYVPGLVARRAPGYCRAQDRSGGGSVVSDHPVAWPVGNDPSPGGSALLVGQSPAAEPVVEWGFAAVKRSYDVVRAEQFGAVKGHGRSRTVGSDRRRRSASAGRGGRSSASLSRAQASSSTTNTPAVG